MTQKSKTPESKIKRYNEIQEIQSFKLRLNSFFRRTSTFEIRWAKSWRKDSISRAVYKDEFLDQNEGGFTRKELKKLIEWDLVMEKSYTDHKKHGGRRGAIVQKYELLPQVTPFKKFMSRFDRAQSVAGAIVLVVFILTLIVLSIIPWKRAFGFGHAPVLTNIQYSQMPPHPIKFFDDTEAKVRCYWFGDDPRLACVKR